MASRPLPARVRGSMQTVGEHLATWRKLHGLTSQQVAERAGISRSTLSAIENGGGATLGAVLAVVNVLGQLDRLVASLDPYETDLGRARADQNLPERVRP